MAAVVKSKSTQQIIIAAERNRKAIQLIIMTVNDKRFVPNYTCTSLS